jgi:hypothetical protein
MPARRRVAACHAFDVGIDTPGRRQIPMNLQLNCSDDFGDHLCVSQ